jgi:amino acid transporter
VLQNCAEDRGDSVATEEQQIEQELGLKEDSVSLWGDFVVSVANVAPSSSVAYTLALLLTFAGHVSPLAVLVVGLGMSACAVGYASLNRWRAHAGAPYVWVGEAVTPSIGVGTGLLNVAVSTFANVGNITLAGAYFLFVVAPTGDTFSNPITWLVATAIMAVMVYLAIRGIRPTVRLQWIFVFIEYSAMISFVILALIHESGHTGGATLPSFSAFTFKSFGHGVGGFTGLAKAAVPCGFLYLGWEATAVLGEESTNRKINPGRAMIMGTLFLTVWYTFLIWVFQGVSSTPHILNSGTDVLAFSGQLLVPGFWGRALPLAVLVAVIGTCQIQMTEPSRVLYALARDKLIPKVFGLINKAHQTPWAALLILAAIPPILLIPYLINASANHAIGDIISSDGMIGLFMYFVVPCASVWFYRDHLATTPNGSSYWASSRSLVGSSCWPSSCTGLKTQAHIVSVVTGHHPGDRVRARIHHSSAPTRFRILHLHTGASRERDQGFGRTVERYPHNVRHWRANGTVLSVARTRRSAGSRTSLTKGGALRS